MTLASGMRLGPYEITAKLGEGGMGEVYRVTDTKLKRDVAIKVLPQGFTEDRERLARFEREAQLLAQLQHPNIASIYGLEESDGIRALVMELVDGPTLAERLESGPLSLNESLSVSLQIAQALEEAHEKGIVHRDLKPQNVKASIEGKVKVLDFGLAKAMDPEGSASGSPSSSLLAKSPTLTMGATVQGMILGTAAYMAPEQARGVAVDARADIWAFGVVLFEMLSGESLFAADTVPDTLARVLTREVDLAKLPTNVPPAIRRLVRRCLVRQPKDRLHSIADARIVIEDVLAGRMEEPTPAAALLAAPSAQRSRGAQLALRALPWIAGALAGFALAIFAVGRGGGSAGTTNAGNSTVRTLVASGASIFPSVSRDGRTLAFNSVRSGDQSQVWIKDLETGSERLLVDRLSGGPAIAPDGTSVLYMAGEEQRPDLYRMSLATREERLLAREGRQGAWAPDGRSIVFLRKFGLMGAAELVTSELDGGRERILHTDAERRMNSPRWAPDGGRIAVALRTLQAGTSDSLGLVDVASGALVELRLDGGGRPGTNLSGIAWISERRLALLLLDVTALVSNSGRLALLDADTGALRSVLPLANVGWGLDVAGPGSLIVGIGADEQNLHEAERGADGRWNEPALETEGPFRDRQPIYSPDGRWLLFTSNRSGNLDVWRKERSTGTLQKLTDHAADDWDPALSADGSRLLFSSNRTGRFQIWIADADGSSPRQVTELENAQNPTMTSDGAWIVFVLQDAGVERNGIWKIRPDGSEASLVAAGAYLFPETSPDGRYAAFGGARSPRRIVRLADGALFDTALDGTNRYRWTVEGGRTFLWTIAFLDRGNEIRRYPFDPERGVLGPAQVMLASGTTSAAETFGVARDGSAVTFASVANRRAQLIRIDGLEGLER